MRSTIDMTAALDQASDSDSPEESAYWLSLANLGVLLDISESLRAVATVLEDNIERLGPRPV